MLSALRVRGGEVGSLGVGVLAETLNGAEQILWAGTPRGACCGRGHTPGRTPQILRVTAGPPHCPGGLREGSAPAGPQSLFT